MILVDVDVVVIVCVVVEWIGVLVGNFVEDELLSLLNFE